MSATKLLVLLVFIAILASLASGLVFLFRDDHKSRRLVKSLTWRIGLSIALFAGLLIAAALGLIEPGKL